MFGDTLVPIDGSRSSRRAIRVAAAISGRLGGQLDVVCFSRSPISRDFRRHVHDLVKEEGGAIPMHVEVDVVLTTLDRAPRSPPTEELP